MAALAIALLSALLAVSLRSGDAIGADSDGCNPSCVILIQVDGLEPKDIDEHTTPYLWRLSHPRVQGQSAIGTALNQRSGWIWQAPRGVVSSGTASATASLLTGAYPEKSGIPADDFHGPTENGFIHQRLGAGGYGDMPHSSMGADVADPVSSAPIDTLVGAARNDGIDTGVFLADPGLAELTEARSQGSVHWFPPGDATSATFAEQQYTGDQRLCPLPRYPDGGWPFPQQPPQAAFDARRCLANDLTTTNKAAADLAKQAGAGVGFAFIHLAELGAVKRLAADTDVVADADDPSVAQMQPAQALARTDEAIATFVEQYANSRPAKWQKTVLMIVGSHGYQATPLTNRIPDPDLPADPQRDLSDYVARFKDGAVQGSLRLVPQGTMATIYYGLNGIGEPEDRHDALAAIKARLEDDAVNEACALRNPAMVDAAQPRCIRAVYYTDKDTPDTEDTVARRHPTWRLDARHPDTGSRTGASGDLVVELEPGWAAGRAVGIPRQAGLQGAPVTNAYTASAGGPRERAVAALVNGPASASEPGAVRDLDALGSSQVGLTQVKYYPVSNQPVDPSDNDNPPPVNDPACPDTATDPGGLSCANHPSKVGDDPDHAGHEAQPVTVDFALTISALMQLPFERQDQLQGRVLQEAFVNELARPCIDCEPEPVEEPLEEPPPLPPPPPPEVVRPEGFNFHGLVRKLEAQVVDSRNRPYSRARRGAVLSTIRLEADFGKPESAITLTFYRRTSRSRHRARRGRVVRLRAIARFDPFVVKRGHVTMRLKIPTQFRPTHVGVTVREIARTASGKRRLSGGEPCTTLKTRRRVRFRCTGPSRGVIVRVADAHRLHKRKGRARAAPKRGR